MRLNKIYKGKYSTVAAVKKFLLEKLNWSD